MKPVSILLPILMPALLAGCAGGDLRNDPVALERSWRYGLHTLPADALRDGQFRALDEIREHPRTWGSLVAAQKLEPGTRLPAVIYLHGCAGNQNGDAWSVRINRLGYAFFAPDSLARPRRSLCDEGAMKSRRIPLRTAELRYALAQIRALDWIDSSRLVLIGFSEGAQTASAWGGNEFAGIVLLGTDCRFVGGTPRAPGEVAVLALMGSRDRYYRGTRCQVARRPPGSDSVLIDGATHNLRNDPTAQRRLDEFLALF